MGFSERDYLNEINRKRRDNEFQRKTHDGEHDDAGAHQAYRPRRNSNYSGSRSGNARLWKILRQMLFLIALYFAFQNKSVQDFFFKHATSLGHAVYAPLTADMTAKARAAQDRFNAQSQANRPQPQTVQSTYLSPPVEQAHRPISSVTPMPDSTGYPGMDQQVVMVGNVSYKVKNELPAAAIFVRMFHVVGGRETRVREFYVLPRESMTLNRLDDGKYLFRYKNLSSGNSFTTAVFDVGRVGDFVKTGSVIHASLSDVNANRRITDAELNAGK